LTRVCISIILYVRILTTNRGHVMKVHTFKETEKKRMKRLYSLGFISHGDLNKYMIYYYNYFGITTH